MSITIDTFKSNFDTGARANLFDVHLLSPSSLGWQFSEGDMLRCRSVDMEGSSVGTNTRNQYNSGYEIPDGTVDQGGFVDISFLCDQSFHDRALIEAWHNWIYQGTDDTSRVGSAQIPVMKYLDSYIGKMEVYALRKDETKSMKYTYYDVYPSSFDSLSFGADEEGILEISATFQYRNWTSEYLVEDRKENRSFENIYNEMKSKQPQIETINRGGEVLDGALSALKVGGRFNKKADGYFKKLSQVDSAANKFRNIFGGG
jgi:hypothetical protein